MSAWKVQRLSFRAVLFEKILMLIMVVEMDKKKSNANSATSAISLSYLVALKGVTGGVNAVPNCDGHRCPINEIEAQGRRRGGENVRSLELIWPRRGE
jgi:hypothetical protein